MTAQIPDTVIYNGEEFKLVGINGNKLFQPEEYRLKPIMASTACYNGYLLIFKCEKNEFLLDKLFIRTLEKPVPINGKKAKKYAEEMFSHFFSHQYTDLHLKVHFTGSIVIARDFIEEKYVHMGYQSSRDFREVYKLTIKDDSIIEVSDLSKRMEEKRIEEPFENLSPTNPNDSNNVKKWIEKRFSRKIEDD